MLRRQPTWLVLGEALALIALIGWVDYATGWEWSFFIFYSFPIVLIAWKTSRRLGFLFACLSAAVWAAAVSASHPYHTGWALGVAVFGRWFYFSVLVVAVAAVKAQREWDRAQIATLEQMQTLEREILRTCEMEQQRMGRDLHDNPGPHLAAMGYAATFRADELRAGDQPAPTKADQIREMAGDAISLVRDLARGICPVLLDGAGLSITLEKLARTTSSVSGVAVSFNETGDTHVVNPDDGLHLYRIAQEAVNNALKHGGARKVTILLSKGEHALRLAVADDGKGIASPPANVGMGMHSMQYRSRALRGALQIDSRPNEGTVVTCEMPSLPPRPGTSAS